MDGDESVWGWLYGDTEGVSLTRQQGSAVRHQPPTQPDSTSRATGQRDTRNARQTADSLSH